MFWRIGSLSAVGSAFLSLGRVLDGLFDILAAENILGPCSGSFIRHCHSNRYARKDQENLTTLPELTAGKCGFGGRGFVAVKKSCPSFFQVEWVWRDEALHFHLFPLVNIIIYHELDNAAPSLVCSMTVI